MRKLLLIALLGSISLNAQETETPNRQNDIMLSPIELIAAPLLNVSYERLLSKNSGVGINGMFYLGNTNENENSGFSQISPYYRMYFGKNYASGFFVEGFVPITMTKDSYYQPYYGPGYSYSTLNEDKNTTIGVGVGFGGKWVARNNIIFEASMGVARRFGMDKKYDSPIAGKGMLGIGYRF
ncbi:DUF3575 domain-containing protein [Kaistella sp.]|uniref:DUF3575 domain-containing protein n=1 Tax=Kaistella sp. TaxID=2782235 RepID=UPI003C55400F